MKWRDQVDVGTLIHQEQLDDIIEASGDGDVEGSHLLVVGEQVRVGLVLEHQVGNYLGGLEFNGYVKISLTDLFKMMVYVQNNILAALVHLVDFDKLYRLVVLYKLK